MSERVLDQAEQEATQAAPWQPAAPAPAHAVALELQRKAGNRAVAQMLARRESWGTQAQAEATAARTDARLRNDILPYMARHSRRIVRNTAELFTGSTPLLTLSAITKRSDSAALIGAPTAPAWANPAQYDVFFTGTTMNNTWYTTKNMIGTITGTVMYVRGHFASGEVQSLEGMAETIVHECSHFFVEQYGELPNSASQPASYHRYADEFRAYWVEGRVGRGMNDRDRATAIREHLIGDRDHANSGYPDLHNAYFSGVGPAADQFRHDVDTLAGPIGYNLDNSIRLHELWRTMRACVAGTKTVDDVVFAIARLPATERAEAARSTLIQGLETQIGGVGARRIRAALSAPTSEAYVYHLNPRASPQINLFLGAIILGDQARLKSTYAALSADDRRQVHQNPAFMSFVDHHQIDTGLQAAIFAMTETGQTAQFDEMLAFLATLRQAKQEADAGTLAGVPAYVTTAMGRLHMFSRWTLFSWGRESTMREYVDVLPQRVANEIRERLRD